MDFLQVVEESKRVSAEEFIEIVTETSTQIASEQEKIGNLAIEGKLVNLAPTGETLVIGDLHGALESLSTIFTNSSYTEKLAKDKDASIVFLGDYGDRGAQSPEVYYCILSLKREFPEQVVLLRGNHEAPSDLIASPHDLPKHLQRKFQGKWVAAYQALRGLFEVLHLAVYVEKRYLMLHGGLPVKLRSLQDIANAKVQHPEKPFLEEILWNDPEESIDGTFPSPRGAGNLFGKTITDTVLERLNAKILIRGHESANEGFKLNHEGKILTLFSMRGQPYFNKHGAYLQLPLQPIFNTADQLIPYINKF